MTTRCLTKCVTIEFNKAGVVTLAILWTTVVNLKHLQLKLVLVFSPFLIVFTEGKHATACLKVQARPSLNTAAAEMLKSEEP